MSSIKYSSDLQKVMKFLKSLNTEYGAGSGFPTNPSFASGPFVNTISNDDEFLDEREQDQGHMGDNIYSDGYETNNEEIHIDGYEAMNDPEGEDSRYQEGDRKLVLEDDQVTTTLKQDISRKRLREAIIWSEIIGPPACRRRHIKSNRYR